MAAHKKHVHEIQAEHEEEADAGIDGPSQVVPQHLERPKPDSTIDDSLEPPMPLEDDDAEEDEPMEDTNAGKFDKVYQVT